MVKVKINIYVQLSMQDIAHQKKQEEERSIIKFMGHHHYPIYGN